MTKNDEYFKKIFLKEEKKTWPNGKKLLHQKQLEIRTQRVKYLYFSALMPFSELNKLITALWVNGDKS